MLPKAARPGLHQQITWRHALHEPDLPAGDTSPLDLLDQLTQGTAVPEDKQRVFAVGN